MNFSTKYLLKSANLSDACDERSFRCNVVFLSCNCIWTYSFHCDVLSARLNATLHHTKRISVVSTAMNESGGVAGQGGPEGLAVQGRIQRLWLGEERDGKVRSLRPEADGGVLVEGVASPSPPARGLKSAVNSLIGVRGATGGRR